VEQVYG
jgi:major vault protein